MTRNPFEEVEELLERMSRQVEEGVGRGTAPVDIRDAEDAFEVVVDLPGYDAEDVDLELSGRRLEITAEREREETEEGADYVRRERHSQSIGRTVRLPDEVEEEAVTASLEGGILTVTLPKRHADEGKQIEIED